MPSLETATGRACSQITMYESANDLVVSVPQDAAEAPDKHAYTICFAPLKDDDHLGLRYIGTSSIVSQT
jgi:hypothetical protein